MKKSLFVICFVLSSFIPFACSSTHVVPKAVVKEFNTQIKKVQKPSQLKSSVLPKAVVKEFNRQIAKAQKKNI
jgi:hypothetical protein